MSAIGTALLISNSVETFAQSNYFNSSRNWAFNKKEVYFGLAATQFLGDLGGGEGPGRNLSPQDINIGSTRVGFNGGYRYRFAPRLATKTNLNFSFVSGDDKLAGDLGRRQRNLHFKSMIVELSQQLEFIVWFSENVNSSKRRMGSYRNNSSQVYLFAGFGAFYYNPKAEYNGDWVALRPLGTEGQNMPDGPKAYSPFSFSIPTGVGFKTSIGSNWRLGVEVAIHKTFTDYIDDVSGTYYSNMGALAANNPMSAALANRMDPQPGFDVSGRKRGNPENNDALVYINVHAIYNLSYKKGPRRAKQYSGVKTKF